MKKTILYKGKGFDTNFEYIIRKYTPAEKKKYDKEKDVKEDTLVGILEYRGYTLPVFEDDICCYFYLPNGKLYNTMNFTPLMFAGEEFAYVLDKYLKEREAELKRLTTHDPVKNYKPKFNCYDDSAKMRSQELINKLGALEDFEYKHETDLLNILNMIETGDMYYLSKDKKEILYTDRFSFHVYGHVHTEKPLALQANSDGAAYFTDIIKKQANKNKQKEKIKFEERDFMLSDYGTKFALTKKELETKLKK